MRCGSNRSSRADRRARRACARAIESSAFAGVPVNGIDDLHRGLTAQRIGGASRMRVVRGTQLVELQVTPVEAARRT